MRRTPECLRNVELNTVGGDRLCHSHIHLDKCYILDQGEPLTKGCVFPDAVCQQITDSDRRDFQEALRVTSDVKKRFRDSFDDLYSRGGRLVRESVACGVTSLRAHVEVDRIVEDVCVDVAVRLRREWANVCDINISRA